MASHLTFHIVFLKLFCAYFILRSSIGAASSPNGSSRTRGGSSSMKDSVFSVSASSSVFSVASSVTIASDSRKVSDSSWLTSGVPGGGGGEFGWGSSWGSSFSSLWIAISTLIGGGMYSVRYADWGRGLSSITSGLRRLVTADFVRDGGLL